MTKTVCTADLHENLIDIPECDVLLIAGDVSFAFKGDLAAKQAFLFGEFREWLERVPATEVVLVAGNHDQSIEAWGLPDGLRCHYLEDSGAELCGLKLWGTPWQPWFHDWAFNAPRRYGEERPRVPRAAGRGADLARRWLRSSFGAGFDGDRYLSERARRRAERARPAVGGCSGG